VPGRRKTILFEQEVASAMHPNNAAYASTHISVYTQEKIGTKDKPSVRYDENSDIELRK
jgi:hypothetical protein